MEIRVVLDGEKREVVQEEYDTEAMMKFGTSKKKPRAPRS